MRRLPIATPSMSPSASRCTARRASGSHLWSGLSALREEREGVPRAVIAEQLRTDSAKVAAIDGAVAGTPFLIALIPGYLLYLRQEARMLLRIAALYERDPRELETAAEMLALRGVHPTVDAARSALLPVRDTPLPEKPAARRPWRTWVRSVYVVLIYGGFLSAPSDKRKEGAHPWVKTAIGVLFGLTVWVVTWVFPLSFMIAMAWGCDSSARAARAASADLLRQEARQRASGDRRRQAAARRRTEQAPNRAHRAAGSLRCDPDRIHRVRNHERQSTGITPLTAVGGLVALSLVIATAVIATRR